MKPIVIEEATTLRAVCFRIGGSPTISRRRHTDAIGTALAKELPAAPDTSDIQAGLSFRDNE